MEFNNNNNKNKDILVDASLTNSLDVLCLPLLLPFTEFMRSLCVWPLCKFWPSVQEETTHSPAICSYLESLTGASLFTYCRQILQNTHIQSSMRVCYILPHDIRILKKTKITFSGQVQGCVMLLHVRYYL